MLDILDEKFARGAFVVLEPTDTGAPSGKSKPSISDRFTLEVIERAKVNRYAILVVDFCDVDQEILINRTKARSPSYISPARPEDIPKTLAHMRRRIGIKPVTGIQWLNSSEIPAGFLDFLEPDPVDLSSFENVLIIGDIHGCRKTLASLIGKEGPRDDVAYVFLGDFINKGPRPTQVLRYLEKHFFNRPGTLFLGGNHERCLDDWIADRPFSKAAFEKTTLPDFEAEGYTRKDAARFLAQLRDAAWIKWGDLKILATHGGLAAPPEHLMVLSAEHLQHGTETSLFDVDAAWEANSENNHTAGPANLIQVHGHRNGFGYPICAGLGSFNLEAAIDRGGPLRSLLLRRRDGDGPAFHPYWSATTIESPNLDKPAPKSTSRRTSAATGTD
jgi:predicted phosphodiesterase